MSVTVYEASLPTANGGTIIHAYTNPVRANVIVTWSITSGGGALTPWNSRSDSSGVATASYNPAGGTPAAAGSSVTVQASFY